jgi:hypothetical protein
MATAMSKVREAVRIIERALPDLQVGSPPHEACIKAIKELSKAIPATEEIPGVQSATLMGMQRESQEGAPMQALQRIMGGGAGAPPGAPPPQAGGGAPPPMM